MPHSIKIFPGTASLRPLLPYDTECRKKITFCVSPVDIHAPCLGVVVRWWQAPDYMWRECSEYIIGHPPFPPTESLTHKNILSPTPSSMWICSNAIVHGAAEHLMCFILNASRKYHHANNTQTHVANSLGWTMELSAHKFSCIGRLSGEQHCFAFEIYRCKFTRTLRKLIDRDHLLAP